MTEPVSGDKWDAALRDAVADISVPPSGLLPGTGTYETWARTTIARHFCRHGLTPNSVPSASETSRNDVLEEAANWILQQKDTWTPNDMLDALKSLAPPTKFTKNNIVDTGRAEAAPFNDGTAHIDHPLHHFDRTCLACWQETEAAPSHAGHSNEPCPDGDACLDARRYGAIHPAPSSTAPTGATPRMDAALDIGDDVVFAEGCRLERELAEAKKLIALIYDDKTGAIDLSKAPHSATGDSRPDTEADGIVFCGKCGAQR